MKKFKKVFAVILSLAMVLGMSLTSFAVDSDKSPATVSGVEDGKNIKVIAYQIVTYNSNGYYEVVDSLKGKIDTKKEDGATYDIINLTAANVLNIAKTADLKVLTSKEFTRTDGTGDFLLKDLELGTWLILVSGATNNLYNPAVISVSQTASGASYGHLNLETDTWNDNGAPIYLKKDEPTITKEAKDEDDKDIVGVQYGEIVQFTVTTDIPGYADDGKDIQYKISDTLNGLELVNDDEHLPTVSVAGDDSLTSVVRTAIVTGGKSFLVDLSDRDEYLRTNAGKQIVIKYYAKVTSKSLLNVDELDNTAKLEYSTNGGANDELSSKEAKTKHYSFGIDTDVSGVSQTDEWKNTGEFIKINDQGDVIYDETTKVVTKTDPKVEYLAGAEFQLHIGSKDGAPFVAKVKKADGSVEERSTFVTDSNGRLQIVGLKDGVDYYLVETKAPQGYSLNNTAVKVYIDAQYEMDTETKRQDKLVSYAVKIGDDENNLKTSYYKYTAGEGKTELLNSEGNPSNPFGFKNTTLASLPSTGGIGTTIFTIGGCAIMIIAAALFFASRRKSAK